MIASVNWLPSVVTAVNVTSPVALATILASFLTILNSAIDELLIFQSISLISASALTVAVIVLYPST